VTGENPEIPGGESDPSARLYDPVRRGSRKDLPEERVRQSLLRWLIGEVGVPARLIAVEYPLAALDSRDRKRADVVVWRAAGAGKGGLSPWLMAECKAPGVRLTEAVADQVRGYAAKVRASHVLVTNGSDTRTFVLAEGRYEESSGLPGFQAD